MRIAAWLLGALLAVAPTAAACACPDSSQRMGCEGTSGCCCGDSSNPEPSHDGCPRSAPAVDTLDQPAAGLEPAPPQDLAAFLPLDIPAPAQFPTSARAADDGLTRPRHSSVLLL